MEPRLILALVLVTLVLAEDEGETSKNRPFGLGHGPAFIGGRDTDGNGTQTALNIYNQYLQYKRLTGWTGDTDYYELIEKDRCPGSCGGNSYCDNGICVCDHKDGWVQVYGQCHWQSQAIFVGDQSKYRKPTKPDWCFCYRDKKNREGKIEQEKFVCEEHSRKDDCMDQPNIFLHDQQFCANGDHQFCSGKDINMICGDRTGVEPKTGIMKNLCECRPDMVFDTDNMECRLYIDADCTYVKDIEDFNNRTKEDRITKMIKYLKREGPIVEDASADEALNVFCNLIESEADEYLAHIIGDFTILGLSITGFLLTCLITCITACCCCQCCAGIRQKIRSYDPRYILEQANRRAAGGNNDQTGGGGGFPTAEMAALGAVAASEYMSSNQEHNDAARLAAMQGGAPQGVQYPGGPSPYPGYAPVPGGQGYVPPAPQGAFQGVIDMAPELALTGAGAYTGNNAMLAMGAAAAMEKAGDADEREDMIRAGVMNNVPAPPGYPGGQPLPSYQPQMPASAANYPRQ